MDRIGGGDPEARSLDVVATNLERLRVLFPEAFTEDKVDFDVLRHLLGDSVEESPEKYGLSWYGKRYARQIALTPSTGTLRPCPEQSVNWDGTQNLMIEGDNLEVLKLLQKSYTGKVKLIYIDPPYNTGQDFIYSDDYRDNIRNYLEMTGQVDGNKRRISSNTEASGRFHTAWLNMMYPRLKLARNLLSPEGVLLASINDVEVASLRLILADVFGEKNFLCQFVWNNEGNVDQQSKIKGVHEYIVAFAKGIERVSRPSVIDPNIEETSKLFNDEIENSITKNGPKNPPSRITLPPGFPAAFTDGVIPVRTDKWPHILDEVVVRSGVVQRAATVESGWSSKNLLELYIANGFIPIQDNTGKQTRFALTKTGAIYGYKARSELQGHVLSVIRNVGTTQQNSSMLSKWGINFSYPKPVLLLRYLVQAFTSPGGDDMVLDLFAGSGTIGQAVSDLNTRDGGKRRFGLVQFPEPTSDASGELRTLFDVCRRRVECAMREDQTEGVETAGFRVFRLDSSNIEAWDPAPSQLEEALQAALEHLKADRTDQDILHELLLKRGFDLCVPIETRTFGGKSVYSVGNGRLIACLDEDISHSEVEELGMGLADWHDALSPAGESTVVFRDSGFADDVAKTNLAAILRQRGLRNIRSL